MSFSDLIDLAGPDRPTCILIGTDQQWEDFLPADNLFHHAVIRLMNALDGTEGSILTVKERANAWKVPLYEEGDAAALAIGPLPVSMLNELGANALPLYS